MSTESEKIAARNVILSAKNHYEVMSLARTCEEDEVKKRHRELVRLVHPDKLQLSSEAENLKTQQAFRAVQVGLSQCRIAWWFVMALGGCSSCPRCRSTRTYTDTRAL